MEYLEYCWYTVLQRHEDFWEQTPKYFFGQLNIHIKVNKTEEKEEEGVEWL